MTPIREVLIPETDFREYQRLKEVLRETAEALGNLWSVCDANSYEVPMGYRNQVFLALAKATGGAA